MIIRQRASGAALYDTSLLCVLWERVISAEERLNGSFCAAEVDLKALIRDTF